MVIFVIASSHFFQNRNGKFKEKGSSPVSLFLIIVLGSLIKTEFELEKMWCWLEFHLSRDNAASLMSLTQYAASTLSCL